MSLARISLGMCGPTPRATGLDPVVVQVVAHGESGYRCMTTQHQASGFTATIVKAGSSAFRSGADEGSVICVAAQPVKTVEKKSVKRHVFLMGRHVFLMERYRQTSDVTKVLRVTRHQDW